MYDKLLARRIFKLLKKKTATIMQSRDPFESAIIASEIFSMLDLFAETVKLDEIDVINLQISQEVRKNESC